MRKLLLLFFSFTLQVLPAQNLVQNGSFEEYVTCPTYWGQWHQVVGWTSPYTGSADYFNACNGNDIAGVPNNQFGYQWAADGQAYVGMATYQDGDPLYREFMATELAEPLQPGVPLCLSFRMSAGGFGSHPGNSAMYTAKGVGLKFFTELPLTSQPFWDSEWASFLYPNTAALHLDVLPTDTTIWYEVSGIYLPDSAYRYLVIGNFFDDFLSYPVLFDTLGHGDLEAAYAFIDDVRASYDMTFCDSPTAVVMPANVRTLVAPNPFVDELVVELPVGTGSWSLALYNSTGGLVLEQQQISGPLFRWPTPALPTGIYHLRLISTSGVSRSSVLLHTTY